MDSRKKNKRKAVTEGARDSISNDEYNKDTTEYRKHKDLAEDRERPAVLASMEERESQSWDHSLSKIVLKILSIALKAYTRETRSTVWVVTM